MNHLLVPGDSAPWFEAPLVNGPKLRFDGMAGRPIVLLFLGSATWPEAPAALALVAENRALFDDVGASFFGVSIDPGDVAERRIVPQMPGVHFFSDPSQTLSREYGAVRERDGKSAYAPHWLLLDPALRVIRTAPLPRGEEIFAALRDWLAVEHEAVTAPVLVLENVFDPAICQRLIDYYRQTGGEVSGFMSQENGMTVARHNSQLKRRNDCLVEDEELRRNIAVRFKRFLLPSIERAFQFHPSRIERYLVARYGSEDGGGLFKPHRDNTTAGTAHRRFACTINLNAGDYEGGDLRFPEFGRKAYRAPSGGAVVFSCSLLHEALPVTKGERYAFLPFFYDEKGAELREANLQYLEPEKRTYRAHRDAAAEPA